MAEENQRKKKLKKRLINKFIKVFILSFTLLFIVVGVILGVYLLLGNDNINNIIKVPWVGEKEKPEEIKKITSFAIFGLDDDNYRTDVIMVLFFNRETKKINIVSIPRDTMITIPDDMYAEILERRSSVNQVIKINEVPAYVESDKRNASSVKVIEDIFNIDIDYYMTVDLEGFRKIVDIIGPIEVEVPKAMKYSDPNQNLYINIEAGTQYLDGAKAEELVRYRKDGDLGRIETQHNFMVAFMKKLLTVENKVNILSIARNALVYLNTDFDSVVDYVKYIDDIDIENINIQTLPGEAKTIGRSYFIHDEEEARILFDSIINESLEGDEEDSEESKKEELNIDAKTLNISVQNGTYVKGLAAKNKEILIENGYKVSESIDYNEKPVATTKIIVPTNKIGRELSLLYKNPIIEVKEDLLNEDNGIIIILGESDGS